MSEIGTQLLKADIAVVGCGGAGLTAALTAVYGGANVIIFEKRPGVGGSTLFAEGVFAVESKMQLSRNILITRDQAFKNHMEATHWLANPRLVRAFIEKSAGTIEWLQQQGVEFIEPINLFLCRLATHLFWL